MALGYDGSIRIDTKINGDGFSKGLAKMSADMEKQVKKSETLLDGLRKKREEVAQSSVSKTAELDAEKAKLASLKKELQEIRETTKGPNPAKTAAESAVKEQQDRVRILQTEWNKIQSELERYDAKIADVNQKLGQQKTDAQKAADALAGQKDELSKIAENAQVGNRHIVDLSHKLAELQERQKVLESAGLGLGYKEYDENARKIASITSELKKYQSELQNTKAAQNELSGFLDTLNRIGSSFVMLYESAKPGLDKLKYGLKKVWEDFAQNSQKNFERIGQRFSSSDFFQNSQENFARIGERISNALEPIMDRLANSDRFQELKSTFSSVFGSIGDFAKDAAQKAGPAISEAVKQFASGFGQIGNVATALVGKLAPVISAIKAVFSVIDAIGKIIGKRFQVVVSQIKGFVQTFKSIKGAIAPITKSISDTMSKAFSASKSGIFNFSKGLADATKSIVKFAAENNALTKLTESVGKKLERLGGMIRRVFVFSVITRGLRELRSELASYLQLNEQFSNSLRTLQGVLLTAFQPIYDAVLPALTTLINFLAKAIAVVSQFTASLFGTTAKKAQQNASSLYKQAHAVEAVGGAAKQAAKDAETAVAAFDEFNILSFPDQRDRKSVV